MMIAMSQSRLPQNTCFECSESVTIEVEGDRPLGDMERESAKRTFIVLPAVMHLLKKVVSELLDGAVETDRQMLRFWLPPLGFGNLDLTVRHGDVFVIPLEHDVLDVAGTAVTVEIQEHMRDPHSSECVE
jgi:hypothetical protein